MLRASASWSAFDNTLAGGILSFRGQPNKKGIVTNRGNQWSGVTIQRLLEDETHLGKIISNKTEGDGHKTKRPNAKQHKRLPRSEWTIVENCHEAVKTQKELDIILSMLSERTLIPNRAKKQTHIFTGLVKCAACGHSHTFHRRDDGVKSMAPCWYKDKLGNKCKNQGIKVGFIEERVLEEISKYKMQILSAAQMEEIAYENLCQEQISKTESKIYKLQKALERLNDTYEMGDYTREEWITRKKKREDEIYNLNQELYSLRKQSEVPKVITNEERAESLEVFFDNIVTCANNTDKNTLYKSIIESIVWSRIGDDIEMKIFFL